MTRCSVLLRFTTAWFHPVIVFTSKYLLSYTNFPLPSPSPLPGPLPGLPYPSLNVSLTPSILICKSSYEPTAERMCHHLYRVAQGTAPMAILTCSHPTPTP